jgi:hypothetical protein
MVLQYTPQAEHLAVFLAWLLAEIGIVAAACQGILVTIAEVLTVTIAEVVNVLMLQLVVDTV